MNNKYYNYQKNNYLNLKIDGCSLKQWFEESDNYDFATHPKGFKIFLSPEKIERHNEYIDSDPYTVKENIGSEFHKRRFQLTLDLIRKIFINKDDINTLLDLGCGEGHITQAIYNEFPSIEISGLDYAISAIEYANEHYPGIDFCVANAYDLPYSPNYFDAVVCNNLWEHVPDPLRLLNEIIKVLKPNGYIIISTPSRYHLRNLLRVILGQRVVLMSNYHVTEYTVGQVIEQLNYGGFELVKMASENISPNKIVLSIIYKLFKIWIFLTKSHHNLEQTVFYLFKKSDN